MMMLSQLIINGLIAGAIYALIASGFSLVYNLKKFFHIAHGAIFTFSAFVAYTFIVKWHMGIILSFILTIAMSSTIGIGIDYLIYKPLRKYKENHLALFLASFAVFIFLTNFVLLIYGADIKSFGATITKGKEIFGVIITNIQIILIIVAVVIMVALYLFLQKTKIGRAMRACSDDEEIASTLGVNREKITMYIYAIASMLAAVAGILIGYEQNIEHSMGFSAILKGAVAAIVGGIGNVPASFFGGVFLGVIENLGIWWLPSGYKDAIAFIILILFLLVKPKGIFGVKKREETAG